LNSQLDILINLQELDSKRLNLEDRVHQIPEKISDLDQTLDNERKSVEELDSLINEGNKQRVLLEGDVESFKDKLSKYKTQLMEVKTNKEYQAMLHEIENTQQEIRTIEDQILEQMMKTEESEQQLGEAKQKFTTQESLLSKKRDELESSGSKIQGDIDQLNNERDQLEKQIQDELLQQYKKIALARNQIAIAEAKDQSCQGCHVLLRPQLFNEIKTSQKIITCENCNRILYYIAS
jgi:hypothetical protein